MTSDPLAIARWIDVVLVVAIAPFALLMGAPALGYAVGAGGWLLARLVGLAIERRARSAVEPRTAVGLTLFSGLGRAWLVALAILLVGELGSRQDGLTAALLAFFAFTVHLATGIATRPRRGTPSLS